MKSDRLTGRLEGLVEVVDRLTGRLDIKSIKILKEVRSLEGEGGLKIIVTFVKVDTLELSRYLRHWSWTGWVKVSRRPEVNILQ